VLDASRAEGLGPARATLQRAPAWTTDWISAEGRRKLREYGIAPPGHLAAEGRAHPRHPASNRIFCPRCAAPTPNARRLPALRQHRCLDRAPSSLRLHRLQGAKYRCIARSIPRTCREPFEHFKPRPAVRMSDHDLPSPHACARQPDTRRR
jgi:ring-1,2-phenylacetyl-CoA epoxidase subunit PaaD